MRTSKHLLLAAMAAAALALAGCGGGGGGSSTGPTTPTTPQPPPKTAVSYATDLNASVAALETLAAAATEDGSALMMAMKYSAAIGAEASDGDSMAATMSAQKVLDARTMLMNAIEAAKADKMEAEEAKAGLPDNADPAVAQVLDDAIMAANTPIMAAEEVLGGDELAMYVNMVTGGDAADPMGTPASIGKDVAMAVAMALGPKVTGTGADGAGLRVAHGPAGDAPTDTRNTNAGSENPVAMANKLETDDHQGMTWAMIAGEDNVMTKRLGADNAEVPVASIAGMVAADSITGFDPASLPTGAGAAGTYMGIPGTVYCLGNDCEVGAAGTADDGKLVGSWYFSPASPMVYYVKAAGATTYSPEIYVNYGHWLVVDDGSTNAANKGQVHVVTFANRSDGQRTTGVWDAPTPGDADLGASSATYSGMAVGRSVHKTLDGNGDITDIQSGRFTADVRLTATFAGTGSTLGGSINNFQGNAVDPLWTVTLNPFTTSDGRVEANVPGTPGGVTEATGQDGTWSADSYGVDGMRPAGIYGGFNAHFSDGHAAGAYATRKD